MRNFGLACASLVCLWPAWIFAADNADDKKAPDIKLKSESFAVPKGVFSVPAGTFAPSGGSFKPSADFTVPAGTFKPSADFLPAPGTFSVKAGEFKPSEGFAPSGFKVEPGTFSSSGFLSRK